MTKNKTNEFSCLNCESEDVIILDKCEDERPNGEKMQQLECMDCGLIWKE